MNIENSTSACLLGLALEFRRNGGKFEKQQAATFLALLLECAQEAGQLEVARVPGFPWFGANDNAPRSNSGSDQA